jgi:hypothetical protein
MNRRRVKDRNREESSMMLTRRRTNRRTRPRVEALEGRALLSLAPLTLSSTGSVQAAAVATDPAGNVYLSGSFTGTVDFEPQDGPDAADTLSSHVHASGASLRDGFVAKYAPAGDLLWVRQFGGANAILNSGDPGTGDLVLDAAGNAYVTGSLRGSDAAFGQRPDATPVVLSAHGPADQFGLTAEDAFLAKLDPDGATLWAVVMGGSGTDVGRALDVDPAGNVYTAGTFTGTAEFGATTLHAAGTGEDLFLTGHAPDGTQAYVRQIGNINTLGGMDVTAGGIHLTGAFRGTIDADPGAGQRLLTASNASQSMFLVKLDLGGNHLWSFNLTGSRTSSTFGTGVTVDGSGNVYVTGVLGDQVDFDPSAGKANLSGGDTYVAKYSASGAYQWARAYTLNGGRATSVVLDAAGNLYLAGWFNGTISFGSGKTKVTKASAGSADGFVLKLDPAGNFASITTMGGAGWDSVAGLAIDPSGGLHVATNLADGLSLRKLS